MRSYGPKVVFRNLEDLYAVRVVIFGIEDGDIGIFSRLNLGGNVPIKDHFIDVPAIFDAPDYLVAGLEAEGDLEAGPVVVDDSFLNVVPTCQRKEAGVGRDEGASGQE
jgi:hypothetical protein